VATSTIGQNGRNLAEALNGFKEELKDFASTRLLMLRAEMKEKFAGLKVALPVLLVAAVMLLTAFLLFTWGLVSLIALAMIGKPYATTVAFFAVFLLYSATGGIAAAYGMSKLHAGGLAPERTMRVLKEDQIWLQSEARTRI
jgi:hypothetical protein